MAIPNAAIDLRTVGHGLKIKLRHATPVPQLFARIQIPWAGICGPTGRSVRTY